MPEARGQQRGLAGLLADAAQALAEAPDDADDAALLASVARVIVPELGDVMLGYAPNAAGVARLLAAEPAAAASAQRIRIHAGAVSMPAGTMRDAALRALHRAAGIQVEIVAEHRVGDHDPWLLVIGSTDGRRRYDDADRATADVLAALFAAHRATRLQAMREAELREQVESLAIAGRELAHLLNNDLTMPVGVVELLLDRSSFTPDLQEMLQAAAKDLAALEQHISAFHGLMRDHSSGARSGSPPGLLPPP